MKGFFKLIPVAVALLTMASCSNDEKFGESQAPIAKVKDGLTVSVEGFENASTRQAFRPNGNKVVWQNGDLINVYDENLTKYDEYKFADTKFVGINDPNKTRISSTKFALFPADRVDYAGWTAKDGTKAVMTIPQLIIYDNLREISTEEGTAYVSNLPMWGSAEGTYPEASVNLKLLTAAFKINIKDAFANNISFLKIEAQDDEPIVGAFEANLGDDEPKLAKGATSLIVDNTMYVDLREVPSYLTYIYVPILARHYDYLKVMVAREKNAADVKYTEASSLEENADLIISDLENVPNAEDLDWGWKTIRNWEAGVTFERANIQPLSKETQYNLDNITTCEMVTKALQQYASYEGELVLNIAKDVPFAITREGDVDDYTIFVPEMKATKVTINVQNAGGINTGYANARMEITDKDYHKPFTGTIELNAADVQGWDNLDLTINLPKTSFSLMGFDGGTNDLGDIDIKNVQTLTIGGLIDDTPVTTKIAPTSTLTISTAKEVIVKDQATVESGIDVVETKNIEKVTVEEGGLVKTNPLSVLDAPVHIQGKANQVYAYGSKSTLYIGEGVSNGKCNYVFTIGNVEINNLEESEAIAYQLNALGNNKITLTQGYVKQIGMNRNAGFKDPLEYGGKYLVKNLPDLTVSDKTNKLVEVTFGANEGLTAIAEVVPEMLEYAADGKYYNFLKFTNKSTWCGETIDGATYPDYVTDAALGSIYTACELASIDNDVDIALYNDIDLNNEYWTNPTLQQSFTGLDPRYANADVHKSRIEAVTAEGVDGNYAVHTISNLKLDNTAEGETKHWNFGLFGEVNLSEDAEIEDLIIDGATSDLVVVTVGLNDYVPGNIGVVAGVVKGANKLTVDNVLVKNVTNFGNGTAKLGEGKNVWGIRGISTLIGAVSSAASGEFVITGNKIESSTITGQAYLGGLIGWYRGDGNVTIADNVIGTAFSVPESVQPGNYDYGVNVFGTVGIAIGQIDNTTTTVDITTSEDDTNNVTNKRGALGFKYNFLFNSNVKYGFHGNNDYVGYSNFTDGQLTIDTQAYDAAVVLGTTIEDTQAADENFNTYIQWSNWKE